MKIHYSVIPMFQTGDCGKYVPIENISSDITMVNCIVCLKHQLKVYADCKKLCTKQIEVILIQFKKKKSMEGLNGYWLQ